MDREIELNPTFEKRAIYFESSDCVEYVRTDDPTIFRRIDEFLTLIISMDSREAIGFKLKGFKHFYLKTIKNKHLVKSEFLPIIKIIENILSELGDEIFRENERKKAYTTAADIAREDMVKLTELPNVA